MHARRLERNRLLRALPAADYEALRLDLEDVSLAQGVVLCEARARVTHVYFPQGCVVALLTPVDPGPAVEVGLVGNEGMVGLTTFLGGRAATTQAVLQVPDGASRMTVDAFRRALGRGPALHALMQSYARALLAQVAQSAACNQRHAVGRRCARWLLMAHDRVGDDTFLLTQEFLARMLGVQRASVSLAAQGLQSSGAIQYARGRVTVTDRATLEAAACGCYALIAADHARGVRVSALLRRSAVLLACVVTTAAGHAPPPNAVDPVVAFRLRDQFGHQHDATDYRGRALVIVAAARAGRSAGTAWLDLLRDLQGDDASDDASAVFPVVPVADLRGVPWVLRRLVRAQFPKDAAHEVLLDWDGTLARRLGLDPDQCTVLVVDSGGRVHTRLTTAAVDTAAARAVLRAAAERAPGVAARPPS